MASVLPKPLSDCLPVLITQGNRIITSNSREPVLLRGVNRSGMEYSEPNDEGFASAAGISQEEIECIVKDWNCNILRIPINQDWALNGRRANSSESYLEDLDRIIRWAAGCGAYTMLTLQWLNADIPYGGKRNFIAPLPNRDSIRLWGILAIRYAHEPAVLFDLYTEPHDRLRGDHNPLYHPDGELFPSKHRKITAAEWKPWARKFIEAIRGIDPEKLIFVSGLDWGYDLRGINLEYPNLVYSTHVYPKKKPGWEEAFGMLAAKLPVFAAEWGGTAVDHDWGTKLTNYFDELEIGWTAWSWSDHPHLVVDRAPTKFGKIVYELLQKNRLADVT